MTASKSSKSPLGPQSLQRPVLKVLIVFKVLKVLTWSSKSSMTSLDSHSFLWGGARVWSRLSDFFIVKFEFCVPKLVSEPIFSLIGPVFIFRGVGRGRGQGLVSRFFHCQI